MIDDDRIATNVKHIGQYHHAIARRQDRCTARACKIYAAMITVVGAAVVRAQIPNTAFMVAAAGKLSDSFQRFSAEN